MICCVKTQFFGKVAVATKDKKKEAVCKIQEAFAKDAFPLTESQIMKKMDNLKGTIKPKSDVMRTGNAPIVLKDHEKKLLDLMDYQKNPILSKIAGKCIL